MLPSKAASRAVQTQCRRFSTTPAPAAISPYRKQLPQTQQQPARRNVSDTASRSAQAATAPSPQRSVPSPAFNREDNSKMRGVSRLEPFKQPEMDHSFVGMKGGEIFHEMMLRQGVKHICRWHCFHSVDAEAMQRANENYSRIPWWCHSARI